MEGDVEGRSLLAKIGILNQRSTIIVPEGFNLHQHEDRQYVFYRKEGQLKNFLLHLAPCRLVGKEQGI